MSDWIDVRAQTARMFYMMMRGVSGRPKEPFFAKGIRELVPEPPKEAK